MPAGILAPSSIVLLATPLLERDGFQAMRLPHNKEDHMSLSTPSSALKPQSAASPLPNVIGLGGALAGRAGGPVHAGLRPWASAAWLADPSVGVGAAWRNLRDRHTPLAAPDIGFRHA